MTTPLGTMEIVGSGPRLAAIRRATRETDVTVRVALDGTGQASIVDRRRLLRPPPDLARSPLARWTSRSGATGDLEVDEHHTVEDVALVLGAALAAALGDRAGIRRFGDASVPMDEAVATAVVDVGGRPYAVIDLPFRSERIGALSTQLIEHALEAFARTSGSTLHLRGTGRNDHHLAEAAFKALARALRTACEPDPRRPGVASTKGTLG